MFGLGQLTKKIFGSSNDRYLAKLQPKVDAINALEAEMEALSDEALKAKTEAFRSRLDAGETVDDLMIEAFAVVREGAKRAIGLRHYDVQLIGGMVLHDNSIAEMKTGEGKTLVATLAAYLNALPGKGVHVVTVNDYLAKRDAEWMGQIYGFLGMTTGVVVPGVDDTARAEAYRADITYATNNELGFDYLRDNSYKYHTKDMVQRDFHFAIVDEVDSILVDEARTPLIISGPSEDKSELYTAVDALVAQLGDEDYEKDEKSRNATLTEDGTERVEQLLREADLLKGDDLYDYENTAVVHHVDQALKARVLFERDKDYIVKDGKVVIIDEFTGRMMDGRRYSGGLHQAIEAKEEVEIQPENQTLASITFQNFFRMYPKLSGMTGTAATEAEEFHAIYGLGVVEIPTNVPVARVDEHDEFYRTAAEKYEAIIRDIEAARERGQPVLVGTVSIEKSEYLSSLLKKRKIKHQVLNARYHEMEAQIVAQAGRLGAVTIATNMAGRGTDIQLGGNVELAIKHNTDGLNEGVAKDKITERLRKEMDGEKDKVLEAGGLYIMATERHESRRIDNQLRGRAGRQGDPGRSKFYLSLEDDLMRIFGPERMNAVLLKLGIEEGEAIVHPWINKAIEKAQGKVEARNYDIRKQLVKFDDVMNDQRKVVYEQRREIMDAEHVADTIKDMRIGVVETLVAQRIPPKSYPEAWDLDGLKEDAKRIFGLDADIHGWAGEEGVDDSQIEERLQSAAEKVMALQATKMGVEFWRGLEKSLLLQVVDHEWKEHLQMLDHLRQGVGLRAYAQRDPLNEYKTEAFTLFEGMLNHTSDKVITLLSQVQVAQQEAAPEELLPKAPGNVIETHTDPLTGENEMAASSPNDRKKNAAVDPNDPSTWGNVGRNAPCPCGSGKKYKHCHGEMANPLGTARVVADNNAAYQAAAREAALQTVGRNEPCPCGSGKKFKHCCGKV